MSHADSGECQQGISLRFPVQGCIRMYKALASIGNNSNNNSISSRNSSINSTMRSADRPPREVLIDPLLLSMFSDNLNSQYAINVAVKYKA